MSNLCATCGRFSAPKKKHKCPPIWKVKSLKHTYAVRGYTMEEAAERCARSHFGDMDLVRLAVSDGINWHLFEVTREEQVEHYATEVEIDSKR